MTGPAAASSGVSSVRFDLPEWPGIGEGVEVSVACAGVDGPDGLIGRWVFVGASPGPASVRIDWLDGGEGAVSLSHDSDRGQPELSSASHLEGPVVRPEMVVRVACGPSSIELPLKVTSTEVLEGYYQGESHQDEYVVQHPFFLSFHKARLRELGRIFKRDIRPGSRVLDVGSGYSIFFLISRDWDFDITCCDLDSAAMMKMRDICPEFTWLVSDATHLPFDDGAFDTVYAGEIIEHVTDPMEALAEWRRVLAPGGTLIMTTPNRERLLACSNRALMPVHPEHVTEMTLGQARALLTVMGFEVKAVTGIYLELAQNWYRPPGKRVDMLISLYNKPEDEPKYFPFMWAGRLFPSRAFDLILVCKKQ